MTLTRPPHASSCVFLLFWMTLALPSHAPAQAAPPRAGGSEAAAPGAGSEESGAWVIPRATGPIRVDGVLDDPAWREALRVSIPYEWFPGDNLPAPVETEVFLAWDEENLYLGFRALDPHPSRIRATLADRDTPLQEDAVGFVVDPFNDERRGFQFRVNPLGVQMDAVFSESEGFEDFSWDAIWASAGRITEEGYEVEVAVPFKSLRFPRTEEPQTWGIMLMRDYPRGVRHRMRSHPTDRNRACILCQMDKMTGIQDPRSGRNVEMTPTLTAARTDRRAAFPSGRMERGEGDYHPGVTARWSATPNLVLNGTLNPDFSQVEADIAQLAVNTRFALYYPERRPFFMEGADFFLTPLNAVFTRTVADPLGGVKLTGKEGPHALGAFLTRDRVNTILLPSNQQSFTNTLEGGVTAAVLRYRRDVAAGSTVGALVTAREGEGYHNRVYGADAFLRLSPTKTVQAQLLRSGTEYPRALAQGASQPLGAFGGSALHLQAVHRSREWLALGSFQRLDRSFRADAGFISRVDTRTGQLLVQRTVWGQPGGWYSYLSLSALASRTEDLGGEITDQKLQLNAEYSGPRQATVKLAAGRTNERYGGELFRGLDAAYLAFELRPSGAVTLAFGSEVGKSVDITSMKVGTQVTAGPRAELRLGRRTALALRHSYKGMEQEGLRAFSANLTQLRALYHFNVRSFFRAIVQYQRVERNPEAYQVFVQRETSSLFTQLLFSYKVNPQTVLFLGYSDNQLGFLDPERVRTGLTRLDRTFFLKLGYAWRP